MEGIDMAILKQVDFIVVHYTATDVRRPWGLDKLVACHKLRFGFTGYHFYITRDGSLYNTLPLDKQGAHSRGSNWHSIGVCYEGGVDEHIMGGDTRTPEQKKTLDILLRSLKSVYPNAIIKGHYQMPGAHTACPGFDAEKEYEYITNSKEK